MAFALDLYGKGVRGETPAANRALMGTQLADRAAMQQRLLLALRTLKAQPEVDEMADRRSWQAMTNFLEELFGG